MATPNPVLPTDDERTRNRVYGQIPRARASQRQAHADGNAEREQFAAQFIDHLLDDLLELRKPHSLRYPTKPAT